MLVYRTIDLEENTSKIHKLKDRFYIKHTIYADAYLLEKHPYNMKKRRSISNFYFSLSSRLSHIILILNYYSKSEDMYIDANNSCDEQCQELRFARNAARFQKHAYLPSYFFPFKNLNCDIIRDASQHVLYHADTIDNSIHSTLYGKHRCMSAM